MSSNRPVVRASACRQTAVVPHAWHLGLFLVSLFIAAIAASDARAQNCDASQAQLTQAIVDSQTALDRNAAALQSFDQALIAPREGALDTAPVVSARANIEEFITALTDFRGQLDPVAQACGPVFANDVQTLDGVLNQLHAQHARADQLLANHQALIDSGEPPMSQAQMETVQRALVAQGYYDSAIDGRLGGGTRAAIRAWQAAGGMPATGYLTAAQLEQLLAAPAPVPSNQDQPQVAGLPPAPTYTDGQQSGQPAAATPPDAATQEICAGNQEQVAIAANRTREYRQQVDASRDDLRTELRQARTAGFDPEAAADLSADVDAYLEQLTAFYAEAESVATRCGDAYDASLAALTREIGALRDVGARIDQLAQDYQALVASGEPAMTRNEMLAIQQGLTERGHYSGAIDALFGPGTRNAIQSWQAEIGAEQTGYLTAVQAAELQRAPVTDAGTAPDLPEPVDEAEPVSLEAVSTLLTEDLGKREAPAALSEVDAAEGAFGAWYARLHAALVEGSPQSVVDQRYALYGAAYADRSAQSLAMVDAHILVGDAYVDFRLYGDAAVQYDRALSIWEALDQDDDGTHAWLLERAATARMMQDLSAGALQPATVAEIDVLLESARALSTSAVGDSNPLTQRIVQRIADLAAAVGEQPEDPVVRAAFDARYAD